MKIASSGYWLRWLVFGSAFISAQTMLLRGYYPIQVNMLNKLEVADSSEYIEKISVET
jgi:hypothetical protein